MPGVTIDFNANLARYTSGVDKAIADLNRYQTHAQRTSANVISAFKALAVGLSGVGVASYGKAIIDLADEMNDLSQRIGINIQDLATWKLATAQSGTTTEALAKGVKGLSTYMLEHGERLRAAGVTANTANGAMVQLADIFAGMDDGIEKTTLAVQIFGKSGMDMIPMLNQGSKGLQEAQEKARDYGARLAELAPHADRFNDLLAEMSLQAQAAKINLGVELVPELVKLAEQLQAGRQIAGGWVGAMWEFGVVLDPVKGIPENLKQTRLELEKLNAEMAAGLQENLRNGGLIDLSDLEKGIGAADRRKKFLEFMQRQEVMANLGGKNILDARDLSLKTGPTMERARLLLQKEAASDGKKSFKREFDPIGDFGFKLSEMNEKFKRAGFDARDKEAGDAVERLNRLLAATPTGQFEKAREEMQFFADALQKNVITEEQYLELVGERYGKSKEAIAELNSAARDLGFTFSSAFEDAIVGGKDLSSVLQGLAQDVTRIFVRKTVTEPLGESLAGAFKGIGGGGGLVGGIKNLFTFDGGGYTGAGSRSGGLDGKGGFMAVLHPNETVVDHTKGGAGDSVIIYQVNNIDSRSDQGTIAAAMVQAKNAAVAEVHNAMRRGSWA